MNDVVVIGGGVSGLAIAHDLMVHGHDVTLLERQVQVGGNARSLHQDGFLMELGPTTMNAALPGVRERLDELDLNKGRLPLGPGVKKRYLADHGRLSGISVHPAGFLLSNFLSLGGRARMMAEMLIPRRKSSAEESVHAFINRRFGHEFAERVFEPMAAGIFMADSHQLSVQGAFPRLAELEARHGSIIRAVLAAKRGNEPGRQLFSWTNGIATLPLRLAELLGARVRTGVTVNGLKRRGAGFEVTTNNGTLSPRKIVLAVQPHVAAMLLEDIDPNSASAAADIPAPPVATCFFAYHRDQVAHPLDGLGFLSARSGSIISGAQFPSTMFAGRAPDGFVSISAYLGGARRADLAVLPGAELLPLVERELKDLLGIKGVPVMARAHHWSIGLPHYTLGHSARRAVLETTPERIPGLYLTGNYLSGVSLTSCLEQAKSVAKHVRSDRKASLSHHNPSLSGIPEGIQSVG